jgi:hypothetical protein
MVNRQINWCCIKKYTCMKKIGCIRLSGMAFTCLLVAGSCSGQLPKYQPGENPSIKQAWSTDTIFKTPESVLYDRQRKVIYVANINGDPSARDGNGFISKLGPDGRVMQMEWIKGLDAPKGMAIWKDRLYVSDIRFVVEIDIEKAEIINRYEATDAVFLNDISCDINGHVYISDSGDDKIYMVYQGRLEIWVRSPELKNPNGLWVENDNVLVGCENRIVSIHHDTRAIKTLIENTGGIDGLVPDGYGNYIISDWKGHIQLVGTGISNKPLLDTTPQEVNAADIDYLIDERILLVPTFYDNRIVAYLLN